ncbi:MAG: DsbA family protein [Desulfobacterales bacterium]
MKKTAARLGLPFGDMRHIYNTRLAQELAVWADEKGQGPAFHHAVFVAYFVENNNIGDPDVLTALAASVGLDRHGPCRDGGEAISEAGGCGLEGGG